MTRSKRKPGGAKDEGIALIVGVRLLQFLIIVALWLLTSYFGTSCLDRAGFPPLSHGRSEVMAHGQPNRQRT